MSVIKVKTQKDFTVLYNVVLENPKLSFKAKGLWAYCMSRPNDWQFHVSHLATVSKNGVDSVYAALKELIAEGLVQKVQKNEKGKFGPVDYIIYPYPQLKESLPRPENPEAVKDSSPYREEKPQVVDNVPLRDFPETENPALLNKDILLNKETKKELSIVSQKKWGDFVEMTEENFLKLVKIYSQSVVLDIFQSINDYCANNRPKGYKDYVAAFRTFYKNYKTKQEDSSWKNKKYPTKSNSYKDTSSERDLPPPVLVPFSSIMPIHDCFSPGFSEQKES